MVKVTKRNTAKPPAKATKASKSKAKVSKPTKAASKTKKIVKPVKVTKTPIKAATKAKAVKKVAAKTIKSTKTVKTPQTKTPAKIKNVIKKRKLSEYSSYSSSQDQSPVATKKGEIRASSTFEARKKPILGYTVDQLQKYQQLLENLADWSNQKLKDALKNNLQSMSGNKHDLIRKVADGMVLGRIPRCGACFGGRPAFDYIAGIYSCKGFHDDTDFINCGKVFALIDIKRDPWTN